MMHLIRHEGREQLVSSLEGYEDAEVIERDVPDPPCDTHFCWRRNGEWVVDDAALAAAEENARLSGMTRTELVAEAQKSLLEDLVTAGVVDQAAADGIAVSIQSRVDSAIAAKVG